MTEETNQIDQEQPNLSIGDIVVLKQVVEIATSRGALKAEELSAVGAVYDRVGKWLASVIPTEQDVQEEQTDSEDAINDEQGETNA